MATVSVVYINGEPVETVTDLANPLGLNHPTNGGIVQAVPSGIGHTADWMANISTSNLLAMTSQERATASAIYSNPFELPPEVAAVLSPGVDPYASLPYETPTTPFPPLQPTNPQPVMPPVVQLPPGMGPEGPMYGLPPGWAPPAYDPASPPMYSPPTAPGGPKVQPVLADMGGTMEAIRTDESTPGIEQVSAGSPDFWIR